MQPKTNRIYNMKFNIKNSIVLVFMTMEVMSAYCQKCDTTFYNNKEIRSIEVEKNGKMVLQKFVSELGVDLLTKQNFNYKYFDDLLGMTRIVDIENNSITQEYWVSGIDNIYNRAEFEPDFDLKVAKFYKYVSKNLAYPTEAFEKDVQGKVMISFIVAKDGLIERVKPITNIGYGLENAAIELINKYKNWGILYLDGKPIECYFRLPITFRL